jgi:hypothetical protein
MHLSHAVGLIPLLAGSQRLAEIAAIATGGTFEVIMSAERASSA